MRREPFMGRTQAAQMVWCQNFAINFGELSTVLGFSLPETTAVLALVTEFASTMQEIDNLRGLTHSSVGWRQAFLFGPKTGLPAIPPPVLVQPNTPTVKGGVYQQICDVRAKAMASLNYTVEIGQTLGFYGAASPSKPAQDVFPVFKSVTAVGNVITLVGSMQGFTQLKVSYAKKGGEMHPVAYLNNTPGSFAVQLAQPGVPEVGQLQAIFVRNNAEYGIYCPAYGVTLT